VNRSCIPFSLVLIALLASTLVGEDPRTDTKKPGKKDDKQTNAPACPVSGKSADANIFAAHKGGKVFFDTEESKKKFAESTAQYTAAANFQLAATGQARQMRCPINGSALGPTSPNVAGIRVCCPGCQGKIARMTQQQRLEMMFGPNFDKLFAVARSQ